MAVAVRWIVILSLFLLPWTLPATWIGSPRDALALGLFIGGMTVIVLDSIFKE
jgi:hypothetical protein